MAFIDSPVQYSSTAARFIAAGLPRGVVRVNWRLQPLQRQRCRPQAWPDLISIVPSQRGQWLGCVIVTVSPVPPFRARSAPL